MLGVHGFNFFAVALAIAGGVCAAASAEENAAAGGPAIPGVCVLDQEAVFNTSKVGKNVTEQYRAALNAAQSETRAENDKISADAKVLEAEKAKVPEEQYRSRQKDFAIRLQSVKLETSQRSQDLEATRKDVVKRIAKDAQPFVDATYKKYRCSLLLARSAVLMGNPGMDVTDEVIAGLDGKITTMTFARAEEKR